jgi:hypothetical protein
MRSRVCGCFLFKPTTKGLSDAQIQLISGHESAKRITCTVRDLLWGSRARSSGAGFEQRPNFTPGDQGFAELRQSTTQRPQRPIGQEDPCDRAHRFGQGKRLIRKSLTRKVSWRYSKNTASEWIQDKCPQLGAALAYFTVFSLAPLVLAVFEMIFGGSDHAQQKLTGQLQYLIDPSGIKVIQDIAANASKPQAGFVATTIGVVLALFGASGVFEKLQDALKTIWGVKPKPGGGVMGFIRTPSLRLRWSEVCVSCCWSL